MLSTTEDTIYCTDTEGRMPTKSKQCTEGECGYLCGQVIYCTCLNMLYQRREGIKNTVATACDDSEMSVEEVKRKMDH